MPFFESKFSEKYLNENVTKNTTFDREIKYLMIQNNRSVF